MDNTIIITIIAILLNLLAFWLIRKISKIEYERDEYHKRYSIYSKMLQRIEHDGVDVQGYFDKVREEEVRNNDDSQG